MKKYLLMGLFGLMTLAGCTTYVGPDGPYDPFITIEPTPVVIDPLPVVIFHGPYYGPVWNGYYWNPRYHYYYRPHGFRR